MTTAVAPAALDRCSPAVWVGDPAIIVFAVRYALGVRGRHVPEFVRQSVTANAGVLPPAARQLIVRDIRAWLDYDGNQAPARDRAVWIAALAALGAEA